jgi:hypothetical protein
MFKSYCVVGEKGEYVTYVLTIGGEVFAYQLGEGERLIDAPAPSGMENPVWDGERWV